MRSKPNPVTRTARKVGVSVAGATTVAVGVVLIPLPGPGTLIVLAGLGILGSEFPAAERAARKGRNLLRRGIDRVIGRS